MSKKFPSAPATPVVKEKHQQPGESALQRMRAKAAPQTDDTGLLAAQVPASDLFVQESPKNTPSAAVELERLSEQAEKVLDDTVLARASYDSTTAVPATWTFAQASVPQQATEVVAAAATCADKPQSGKDCDDDRALWWLNDGGAWLKVGLGLGGLILGAKLFNADDPTSELRTGMAAGPFKKNGMTLSYFGTSGLLLELSWDEAGVLTKTVKTALNGDVSIQTSKVDTGAGLVDVITGVVVDFADYTGTLMAVLWDKSTDGVPVEFYDEVAGLIALEDATLRAVTTVEKGQNYLAITPFTELALRKAGVDPAAPADLGNVTEITELLKDATQLAAIRDANKALSSALGVTDIVKVLPVALNDQAFDKTADAQAKLYGEKLASLSRLVPGNLEGGIQKLLDTAPAAVPDVIAASLEDYRDDNDPQNPTTPPEVTIVRPWINATEGRTPVTLRGTSEHADEGSMVRITVFKNGVLMPLQPPLRAEVGGDGAWQVPMPATLADLGVLDGDTLTIRAYIDPDHPDTVDARYDATPPAAPQAPADMLASDDSANNSDDLTSQIRPGFQIGALPEEGMTVELLVDGEPVAATYNAQTGVIQPNQRLSEGVHRITYRYTDFAGNVGEAGAPLQIVVDSLAPTAVLQSPSLSHDSGYSATDWITQVAQQTVRASLSQALNPGETLRASMDNGSTWVDITAFVNGTSVNWTGVTLAQGTSTLRFQVVDGAGNQGEVVTQQVVLDTTAPATPSQAADMQSGSDTRVNNDNVTSNNRPVFDIPALPADAVAVEMLVNGNLVAATVDNQAQTMQANTALVDGVHQVTFRFVDAAGNRSEPSAPLPVTVDTRAPANSGFSRVAVAEFAGTYEPGSTPVLTIGGQPAAGQFQTNPNGTWRYVPTSDEVTAMRATSTTFTELLLTVTDTAGNISRANRMVGYDDLTGPYIKEYIPADNGFLAKDASGNATLNVIFSKAINANTGTIKVFKVSDNTEVASVSVTDATKVSIEGAGQNDVFVTVPGLQPNTQYYWTISAGAFVDSNQEPFLGQSATGTNGWDFTTVDVSIAPDFVTADDMINAEERTTAVDISGMIVSSSAILRDIVPDDLSLVVTPPQGAPAVVAAAVDYNPQSGEFSFRVPALVWAEGRYSYAVQLRGSTGQASGKNADYSFNNLVVDLTPPSMTGAVQSASDDAGALTGELWASASVAVTDDTSPFISGTLSANLSGDARVVVYRRDVTDTNNQGSLVKITGIEGLKPSSQSWSVGDTGLQDGHRYEYIAYVEDAAGNRSTATPVKTIKVDTSAPTTVVSAISLSHDTGISSADRITNATSQTVSGTLTAALAADESLYASLDGGSTWTNITAGVSGQQFVLAGVTLPEGSGQVRLQVRDAAGNEGPIFQASYTVDQTAPLAPASAPDLLAASDSGTSQTDNITRDQRPYLVVGALPPNVAAVELLVDGQVVSATHDANSGTLRPAQAMPHGTYSVAYRWVDAAGNASLAGPGLSVDIDTVAPGVRMANIDISADTGSSSSDFVTKQSAQIVTGQINAPLSQGDRVFGSADGGATWQEVTSLVNANGQLTWNNVQLSASQNSLQFKIRDAAGNESVVSSQPYNLDTTPSTVRAQSLTLSQDTGAFNNDFVTKQALQSVSGQLVDEGEPQTLADGERLMGSADGGVTWQDITSGVTGSSFRWNNVTLSNGANSLRFKVVDLAGNDGVVSTQNYTLDTVAPAAPSSFAWATYPNGINAQRNTVSGVIGDVPFTYTLTQPNSTALNLNSTGGLANHSLFPTGFSVPNQTSIRNDYASINKLTFDSPMSNPVLAFSSIGNPSSPVSIEFPQPVEIVWSTGWGNGPDVRVDVGTRTAATKITGWEGNMIVRFNGTVDEFVFNYLSNETYVNFAFGASVFDLIAPEQDTGNKDTDDITQVTRPAFMVQNKPADAVSAELLINGQMVAATFNATDNTLTPNVALSDGVYQVSYRYIDLAGNASAGGSVTTVTIDTQAPVNTSLTTFTPTSIGGDYEPGTALSLKVNGVSIASNRLVLNAANGTWSFVPTQAELTQAGTGLLNKATSTFDLTATDLAGNETVASKTVTKDVFNAPYVKEFIPTDGGILANDSTGKATLNLVFSKTVMAGTGKIKLFNVSGDALVAEIDVASNAVRIDGSDVYVTLPSLSTGTRYYVTLDAGSFVDSAGQGYLGKTETGTAGWDFTGALASIAPDFVAQDDIVNANESAAVVRITGKVVSTTAVLEDIVAGNLTVSVAVPQGAAAVTATLQSYNNQTGEFIFTVPAQAWANGNYGYTVRLQGNAGDASGVNANYNFANLAVDLVAPSGIAARIDAIADNQGQTQGNLINTASFKLLESGFAPSGTSVIKLTDINVTDLDLTKLSATMGGAWINNGSNTFQGRSDVLYNTASTVYNNDRTSVTFWLQTRDGATGPTEGLSKAIKVELKDSVGANGIELRVIDAAYKQYASTDLSFNWNNNGAPKQQGQVATSFVAGGYGLVGLEFVGDNMSAAMQGSGLTDDDTPTLTGSLTRALAQGERIAIDRTDGQGNTVTVTGKAGLIVDGTTWTFNDGTLNDGQYTYRVYVEDAAGNRTAGSSARIITVDTQPPTVTVTAASLSQDTGISNTDRLTKQAAQTVTGTLSAALGTGEKLMASLDGGATLIDITSTVSGTSFAWPGVTLSSGQGSIRWLVVDAMGSRGTAWDVNYMLDTTAPDKPAAPQAYVDDVGTETSSNSVASSSDDFTPGILVQTGLTNAPVLYVDGQQVASTYNPSTGVLTPVASVARGLHKYTYAVVDDAGNISAPSDALSITSSVPTTFAATPDPIRIATPMASSSIFQPNSGAYFDFAGDLNSDGYSDIVISDRTNTYVVWGRPEGLQTAVNPSSDSTLGQNGKIVSPVNLVWDYAPAYLGDVNNDGVDDFIALDIRDPKNGALVLDVNASSSPIVIDGPNTYHDNWQSKSVGDINGDGVDDFLVINRDNLGRPSAIVFGRADISNLNTGSLGNAGYTVAAGNWSLAGDGVGDFNGDGIPDFVIADVFTGSRVVFGQINPTNISAASLPAQSIAISAFTNNFSETYDTQQIPSQNHVSALGDFNGDGYADFIIGGGANGTSDAFVVFGRADRTAINLQNWTSAQGLKLTGESSAFAWSVSGAGDVNGDGLADVLLGDFNSNKAYVVYGRAAGGQLAVSSSMVAADGYVLTGTNTYNYGNQVKGGGDFNGDGIKDFVIEAAGGGALSGTYVVYGSPTKPGSVFDGLGDSLDNSFDDAGVSRSFAGGAGVDAFALDAASVAYGGAGNDVFTIGAGMIEALANPLGLGGNLGKLARIEGGTGVDTIKLAGSASLDLTAIANQAASQNLGGSRIDGVEVIDLNTQSANTLKLALRDLIDMVNANTFEDTGRKQLLVKGGAGDTVQLMDTNAVGVWTKAAATVTLDGAQYHVLNHNTSAATLYVQQGVAVTDFVAGTPGVTVIDPSWQVNSSNLTIDFSSSPKSGWISANTYVNNAWDDDDSYTTDSDDVFAYEFGRIYWDDVQAGSSSPDDRWELRGWQIGQGDRIKGATLLNNFDGSQEILVPASFGSVAGGDDQIDDGQFEVFYGTLVNGVFTVTSTSEFSNSQTGKGGATHTLVLFDNDTQSRSSNTLNDLLSQSIHASYLPPQGYRQAFDGVEVNLSDPYWLEAAVVSGVYEEEGWALSAGASGQKLSWTAPPDYISIGRLLSDKSAFGAWFDTDEDGVKDVGEKTIDTEVFTDYVNEEYTYSLKGVDFASGSYTVRFVDVVMYELADSGLNIPDGSAYSYAHLDLSRMDFGGDDKVIIDMKTNANDWMGMDVRDPFGPYDHPARAYGNSTLGVYADGIYGARTSTGLFGQLEAGTRPNNSLSTASYARLDIYARGEQLMFDAFNYKPAAGAQSGGKIGINDPLVDFGVPITTQNLEFMLPTTFIV